MKYTDLVREIAEKDGYWHMPEYYRAAVEQKTGHRIHHATVIAAIGRHDARERALAVDFAIERDGIRAHGYLAGTDIVIRFAPNGPAKFLRDQVPIPVVISIVIAPEIHDFDFAVPAARVRRKVVFVGVEGIRFERYGDAEDTRHRLQHIADMGFDFGSCQDPPLELECEKSRQYLYLGQHGFDAVDGSHR